MANFLSRSLAPACVSDTARRSGRKGHHVWYYGNARRRTGAGIPDGAVAKRDDRRTGPECSGVISRDPRNGGDVATGKITAVPRPESDPVGGDTGRVMDAQRDSRRLLNMLESRFCQNGADIFSIRRYSHPHSNFQSRNTRFKYLTDPITTKNN